MCLYTNQFLPKISFKRIPIYKIVYQNCDGILYTWCRFVPLMLRAEEFFFLPTKEKNNFSKYRIEEGMLHAYSTMSEAKRNRTLSYRIIKGYIPPFTRYYIGINGDICAKRMKYLIKG